MPAVATGPAQQVVTLPIAEQAPALPATQPPQVPLPAASTTPVEPSTGVTINVAPAQKNKRSRLVRKILVDDRAQNAGVSGAMTVTLLYHTQRS